MHTYAFAHNTYTHTQGTSEEPKLNEFSKLQVAAESPDLAWLNVMDPSVLFLSAGDTADSGTSIKDVS